MTQNKIDSLHHIKEPMPGSKVEMDEQKFRFMYELHTMQVERNRIKQELDHYYSYQKKQTLHKTQQD